MKTVSGLVWLSFAFVCFPRVSNSQGYPDSLQDEVTSIQHQLTGFEERIVEAENSLFDLTRIRISGYIQAQWQYFENSAKYPYNFFLLQRARLKVKYQPYSGVAFVLEPDYTPAGVKLKDAYVQLNDPWINTFSLWAGQFKKLNYETGISSSQLDVLTRSMVVVALYPGERGLGAKLEVLPPLLPFRIQMAVFNGNENLVITDAEGVDVNPVNKDFDPFKDIMGRFVYDFRLGNFGGLDVGLTGYYGWIKSNSPCVIHSDYSFHRTVSVGQSVSRGWFGVEMQLYLDILGGLSIKGEYLMGRNAFPGYTGSTSMAEPIDVTLMNDTLTINQTTTHTTSIAPCIQRSFMGGYIYLIKNIGKKNKFAIRWDWYDPNTKLTGDQIGVVEFTDGSTEIQTQTQVSGLDPVIRVNDVIKTNMSNVLRSGIADIMYHRISMAWSYYVTDNITIQAAYEIPVNETVGVNAAGEGNVRSKFVVNDVPGYTDYSRVVPQNIFTLRLQAKF